MWIFGPEGLTMPARIPEGGAEGTVDPKWLGPNGDFTMQVRGRAKSHLENVIRDYFEPLGLPYSDIQMTPEMDYNCRFYTTHEAMATVAYKQVMDIDFLKFKPQAERKDKSGKLLYKDGAEYHGVLNSIWGTVCKLGSPGGVWGSYSSANPNGYKASKGKTIVPLNQKGSSGRTYGESLQGLDDSYFDNYEDYPRGNFGSGLAQDSSAWWDDERWNAGEQSSDMDYVPTKSTLAEKILESVEGIPEDQWHEHLSQSEFDLIEPYLTAIEDSKDEDSKEPVPAFPSRQEAKAQRRSKSRKSKTGRRFYKKD